MKKTITIDICDNCNLETHDTADCPDRYPGAVAGTYEEWQAKRDADGEREAARRRALPDSVTLTGEEVAELRRMLVFMTLGGLASPTAQSAWAKLGLNNDIRVSAVAAGSLPPAPEEEDCMCGHPRSQHWGDAPWVACHQSMPPFGEDGSGETCGCWNYAW